MVRESPRERNQPLIASVATLLGVVEIVEQDTPCFCQQIAFPVIESSVLGLQMGSPLLGALLPDVSLHASLPVPTTSDSTGPETVPDAHLAVIFPVLPETETRFFRATATLPTTLLNQRSGAKTVLFQDAMGPTESTRHRPSQSEVVHLAVAEAVYDGETLQAAGTALETTLVPSHKSSSEEAGPQTTIARTAGRLLSAYARRMALVALLALRFRWYVSHTVRYPKVTLSLVAAVLSLAWGGWSVRQGKHTMHSPGPVALAHEKLDCAACHTQPWQPLQRLVFDPRTTRLTMDRACVACHADLVHQKTEIPAEVPNCVSCHREHQGPHNLAQVGDSSCTGCHAQLRTIDGPSTRFERSVIALASHPEFAVLRRGELDPGTILFNHAAHLQPGGIRGPQDKPVVLQCASCHQTTSDGRYMEPIRFDAHCAACHASALVYDPERFRDHPAPHGQTPELLRGLLRERYTDYVHRHPIERGGEVPVEVPLPGLPGIKEVTDEEGKWIHQRLREADRILFLGAGGCRYCHTVEGAGKGWQIVPPNLTSRWLSFAKFSHHTHRLNPPNPGEQENCTTCHAGAQTSTKTSDVLLPTITSCLGCHNQQSVQSARTDCVECHTYHNQVGGKGPRSSTTAHESLTPVPAWLKPAAHGPVGKERVRWPGAD
jgi:predicted CXXCH cytochrome family protein